MIRIDIPGLRTVPGMNTREHWRSRVARVKREKQRVAEMLWVAAQAPGRPEPPLLVTVTRIAPSNGLDPFDNLPSSLKSCVDAVAQWLGIDDKDPRVQYRAAQERGAWGVRIEIESAEIAHAKALIDGQKRNNPRRE